MGTGLLIRFIDNLFDTLKKAYCQIKILLSWQGADNFFMTWFKFKSNVSHVRRKMLYKTVYTERCTSPNGIVFTNILVCWKSFKTEVFALGLCKFLQLNPVLGTFINRSASTQIPDSRF